MGQIITKIKIPHLRRRPPRRHGQSLTEFAMALPFLILLIAGIAEVGVLMIQRNRTALVARETTRFVASGGDDNDSLAVSIQTAQQSFGGQIIAFDEERVDIYIIHATVNSAGNAIIDDGDITVCASEDDFCETHIYPTQTYYAGCCGGVDDKPNSGWTSAQIYNRLDGADITDTELEDLKVVAAVVQYNTTTLIPLPIFGQTDGGFPLNQIVIMRQEATISEAAGSPTQGCSAYPIFISAGATGGDGNTLPDANLGETFSLSRGVDPSADEFNFGLWNDTNLTGGLGARLADSLGYQQWLLGDPPIGNAKDTASGFNYINPDDDPNDQSLHKGDYVLLNTDNANPGSNADIMMQDHITDDRVIRVFAFDDYENTIAEHNPPDGALRISHVVLVELTNYAGGAGGTLDLEFIRLDSSCGN